LEKERDWDVGRKGKYGKNGGKGAQNQGPGKENTRGLKCD